MTATSRPAMRSGDHRRPRSAQQSRHQQQPGQHGNRQRTVEVLLLQDLSTVCGPSREIQPTWKSWVWVKNRNGITAATAVAGRHRPADPHPRRVREHGDQDGVHADDQHHEDVEHRSGDQQRRVGHPPPRPVSAHRGYAQHRQPHPGHHGQRVGPGFDTGPRHPWQQGEHDAGGNRHRPRRQLASQHHDTRRGHPDRQRTGQPRPELGGRKDGEPAMHDQVVQAVDGIDVAQHPPQFRHRAGRGRDGGRLVEPQRRPGRPRGADHDREDGNGDSVELSSGIH